MDDIKRLKTSLKIITKLKKLKSGLVDNDSFDKLRDVIKTLSKKFNS